MSLSANIPPRQPMPGTTTHAKAASAAAARKAQQQAASPQGSGPTGPASWADIAGVLGPILFDWERWLACGFLHLLVGETGKGKSSLALRIAACYLRGDNWPDDRPFVGPTRAVLWLESEGAQALNLQRAKGWGLDLSQILTPFPDPLEDVNLDSNMHRAHILAAAQRPEVGLIVLDSLSAACGANRDENSSQMLAVGRWLARLARDTGKPVIATHHLRKKGLLDGGSVTLDRVRGSSTIPQLSRLVWALDAPNAQDPKALRLSVIKSNLGPFPSPIGVSIEADGVTFDDAPMTPTNDSAVDKAAAFLRDLLAEGPVKACEVYQEAKDAGIAEATLKRAKAALQADSYKDAAGWWWFIESNN